jgi:acetyltransferase (GNAT) family protein
VIREATSEDLDAVLALSVALVIEQYDSLFTPNPVTMRATGQRLVDDPRGVMLVDYDVGEELTGTLGGLVYEHPCSGEQVASEVFWYVRPKYRGTSGLRLLDAFEAWALAHDARLVQMVAPTDRVALIYQRRGYTAVEQTFQRRLARREG